MQDRQCLIIASLAFPAGGSGFPTGGMVAPHGRSRRRPYRAPAPSSSALQAALREYLLKVSSRVSRRKPESAALARYLLAPYAAMADDLARRPRGAAKPAAPTNPAAPTD